MSSEPKLNAEQICEQAIYKVSRYLMPSANSCRLIQDESGAYFVFEFTNYCFGEKKSQRFTVPVAKIEDGTVSKQQLLTALWLTLGKIEGVL